MAINSEVIIWDNTYEAEGKSYICGHCGTYTSPSNKYIGYASDHGYKTEIAQIYICTGCFKPTFFLNEFFQNPGPIHGRNVNHVPESISELYDEARKCYSINAYTSSVLVCRKILMNIAVQEGAPENKKFIEYVNFLETNGYIPPKGRQWVDKIRTKGNEATHELVQMDSKDSKELLNFVEMLLIYVYEFPATVGNT